MNAGHVMLALVMVDVSWKVLCIRCIALCVVTCTLVRRIGRSSPWVWAASKCLNFYDDKLHTTYRYCHGNYLSCSGIWRYCEVDLIMKFMLNSNNCCLSTISISISFSFFLSLSLSLSFSLSLSLSLFVSFSFSLLYPVINIAVTGVRDMVKFHPAMALYWCPVKGEWWIKGLH